MTMTCPVTFWPLDSATKLLNQLNIWPFWCILSDSLLVSSRTISSAETSEGLNIGTPPIGSCPIRNSPIRNFLWVGVRLGANKIVPNWAVPNRTVPNRGYPLILVLNFLASRLSNYFSRNCLFYSKWVKLILGTKWNYPFIVLWAFTNSSNLS